jgi:hypothetical protein
MIYFVLPAILGWGFNPSNPKASTNGDVIYKLGFADCVFLIPPMENPSLVKSIENDVVVVAVVA